MLRDIFYLSYTKVCEYIVSMIKVGSGHNISSSEHDIIHSEQIRSSGFIMGRQALHNN